ncbi:MAG: hypothetical protein HRU21_13375 [Pseudomonadales bacterium]|nr:hypothetical protein [Pseudomonadales bacterium]
MKFISVIYKQTFSGKVILINIRENLSIDNKYSTMEKISYEDMVRKACESVSGKFISRAQIKSFLTATFGWVESPLTKNTLKKTLAKFERKGDSFRVSKDMKAKAAAAGKTVLKKQKLAEKKKAVAEKKKALKEKMAAKKLAAKQKLAVKKEAIKAKKEAAKAKAAAKKEAAKAKKAAKKAKKPTKKVAAKKTAKKAPKKTAAKKPVKKTTSKKK